MDKILESKKVQDPVYMYCTGGIRCEKASVYLKAKGHENVFQLQVSTDIILDIICFLLSLT